MSEFIELHNLIDSYRDEIKNILLNLDENDYKNINLLYHNLNDECNLRLNRLNKYIVEKYPLEKPVKVNGITYNTKNTIKNFNAQLELSKRYSEFHTLCHEHLQDFE